MERFQLIHRVLTGIANQSEHDELNTWLSEKPENQEDFDDLKFLYETTLPSDNQDDETAEAWVKIETAIKRIKSKTRRLRRLKTLALSTAIYLMVLFAYSALRTGQPAPMIEDSTLPDTMSFQDTPIQSVIDMLAIGNHFNVRFSSNELSQCKFTGVFKRGTPLDAVLRVIAKAKDLEVVYSLDEIVLVGDECKI